jgi:hypothetical protein
MISLPMVAATLATVIDPVKVALPALSVVNELTNWWRPALPPPVST